MEDPQRTLPRVFVIGTISVIKRCVLANASCLRRLTRPGFIHHRGPGLMSLPLALTPPGPNTRGTHA